METADHRVHLLHPRCRLCLPDGVEHAAMTARGEDNQALSLYDKIGGELMLEIVGDEIAGVLGRR